MPTLTDVQRRIDAVRQLPEAERRAAAAALLPDVDAALTEQVQDAVAAGAWVRLARAIEPRTAAQSDRETARRIALGLIDGGDPLAVVRAARERDETAQRTAREAREALRAAAGQAVRAGAQPAAVADAAGVSRQVLYGWLSASL
jgi:hypothetical protein